MADQHASSGWDRRGFMRRTGLAAGAAAVLPLAGAWDSATAGADPDGLFRAGRFAEADRGYARILRTDPTDAHATTQRGYVALLSNRFPEAERFLTRAVELAPDNQFAKQLLADTYVRQDQFSRAVPLVRAYGNEPYARQLESVTGTPYQVHGADATRVPFVAMDPLPLVEASVRGGEPKRFLYDTGGTSLSLSLEVAEEAGLRAVSTGRGQAGGQTFTMYFGVLDSFRIGDIELRNFPVHWADIDKPTQLGDPQPAGVIGTHIFYHFLTTLDYANQALILRRKTAAQLGAFRTEAHAAGVKPLPLWLAGDHFPFTLGSVNGHDPRVVCMDTGGAGGNSLAMTEAAAKRLRVRVDYDRPTAVNRIPAYPCYPDEARLGTAVANGVYSIARTGPAAYERLGFDPIANFTHAFFKPFTITFDFSDMRFYISRP
ncbi:aspartyl protease family protein [Actinomycetes bacterium KLBMP 9797]